MLRRGLFASALLSLVAACGPSNTTDAGDGGSGMDVVGADAAPDTAPADAPREAEAGGGCTTPPMPSDPCVRPCDVGNERGVGRYCTPGGGECAGNRTGILICTVDVEPSGPAFCTTPCTTDANCGTGAMCVHESAGSGCVPLACLGGDSDGGMGDGAAGDGAPGDASGGGG